jgi:hypothetical protein
VSSHLIHPSQSATRHALTGVLVTVMKKVPLSKPLKYHGHENPVFETTSRDPNAGWSGDRLTFSEKHTGRALLTPDEVRNMAQSKELLFLAGQRPIVARKLRYYADAEFAGRFDKL